MLSPPSNGHWLKPIRQGYRFEWQLQAAKAVLCGKDVILDAGTGFGKTLCFSLPLLLDDNDIALTISPLTALMVEQAATSRLPTVAVCQDTISRVGCEQLYKDIVDRRFRQVMVSPEIAISPEFLRAVLSKKSFTDSVCVVNIDEAHCISEWGGTFRRDYSQLGTLRGRFSKAICFQVASATLPQHVLDNIKGTLRLSKDVKAIRLTNKRPNVALSVRTMRHSKESKADLRFLIPPNATSHKDVPTTIVYCNKRDEAEDCVDRLREWASAQGISPTTIAYYHALVGECQKRHLEGSLTDGDICIKVASEALGMGCDLRNIRRVVLWGLPPTFCSLVQRAGRAGRDLDSAAEAILIVPSSVTKQTPDHSTLTDAAPITEDAPVPVPIDNEGVRLAADVSEDENDDVQPSNILPRKRRFDKNSNTKDLQALLEYAQTERCRREPWDKYFDNKKKLQLLPGITTTYDPASQTRCCDNCEPRLFEQENVSSSLTEKGLKKGKKKKIDEDEAEYIRTHLRSWRKNVLSKRYFGTNTGLSAATIMSDKVIEDISTCGEHLEDYNKLRERTRWAFGHENASGRPNVWGTMLMSELGDIYAVLKGNKAIRLEEQRLEQEEEERLNFEAMYQLNTTIFDNKTAADYI